MAIMMARSWWVCMSRGSSSKHRRYALSASSVCPVSSYEMPILRWNGAKSALIWMPRYAQPPHRAWRVSTQFHPTTALHHTNKL
jgi:hypothetical protein